MLRHFLVLALALLLASGCATTPPDPRLLDNAKQALDQAVRAGAADYAPLELRFAGERLQSAEFELSRNNADAARRQADEAEVEAQLALARTRAAQTRAELAQRQRDLDQLLNDLLDAFGQAVLE